MKVRNGFVSNSSSSSFVVIMKNGKKLTKKTLLEVFDVKETSPIYSFADGLAEWMSRNVEQMNIKEIHDNFCGGDDKSDEEMIEEIIEDYGAISREDLEKIKNKEYLYYHGDAASDSGEAIESYLCEAEIDFETDVIKISSEGGY